MKVEKLIYGNVSGWFKNESSKIIGNNISSYTPKFENIILHSFKTKEIKDKPLSLFKTGKYVWLEEQEVLLKTGEEQYKIKFKECVLNKFKIKESITDVNGHQYTKYEAVLFAIIGYNTIQKTITKKTTKKEISKNIIDAKTTNNKIVDSKIIEETNQKSGCFSNFKPSSVESNRQSNYGFYGNRLYKNKREHLNQIFKVNKDFFSSNARSNGVKFKSKFNNQKQKYFQKTIMKKDPLRSIGSSFFNILKFLAALILIPTLMYLLVGEINGIFIVFLVLFVFTLYFSFFNKIFRVSFIGIILRFLINIITILALFGIISNILKYKNNDDYDYERDDKNETEFIEVEKDSLQNADKLFINQHRWVDFKGNKFDEKFISSLKQYRESNQFLNNLSIREDYYFWSNLYKKASDFEKTKMDSIRKMFIKLKPYNEVKTMTSIDQLNAILTSIQAIPYYLVHEGSCQQSAYLSDFSKQYHQQNEPCKPNTKYGLSMPSEFMANFKGDCDTRALFLYSILKERGLDVAVLVSEQYGHAILGINIPGRGKYVTKNGKKYLTFETTSKGWKIGQLPPNCSNTRYWKVALN
ncbi:ABC transporter permease [Polaribacter sp.]|uniref:ABC transporter permease n=1 Tax=Polaribacter sp. TaxID=1920175 RepID=UPI0025EDB67D|nr:ABC transporter permease [Polaribacter sp.]